MKQKEKPFGEQLVGKDFNPSKNTKVDKVKELSAELVDIIYDEFQNLSPDEMNRFHGIMHNNAITKILEAQMMAVKFLTLN